MSEIQILTMDDIGATALHNRGNAAVLSELAELFIRKMNDMLGGQDSTEEDRSRTGFVPVNEIPDDTDLEDAVIAGIDDESEEEHLPEPDDDDEDDVPMFVDGMPLDDYLASFDDDGLTCEDMPLTAAEMSQEETPKSYAPTSKTVRRKAERFAKRAQAWRKKADEQHETAMHQLHLASLFKDFPFKIQQYNETADTYLGWWLKNSARAADLEDVSATLAGKADVMAQGERSDARDRRLRERAAKRDRSRKAERSFVGELREQFVTAPCEIERDERQRYEDEYQWEAESYPWCSCCNPENAAVFDWEFLTSQLEEHDLSTEIGYAAALCWIAGMSFSETKRLLQQLAVALHPAPEPAEKIDARAFDPIDDDAQDEHFVPRESGEFGKAVPVLDESIDDLDPKLVRYARALHIEELEDRRRQARVDRLYDDQDQIERGRRRNIKYLVS